MVINKNNTDINESNQQVTDTLVWEAIKYHIINFQTSMIKDSVPQFVKVNNIDITDSQISDLINDITKFYYQVLREGGILFHKDVLNFNSVDEYIEHINTRRKQSRTKQQIKWIDNRSARQYFVDDAPVTKKQITIVDKKEVLIHVIDEYYDEKFFINSNLNKDYILIKERDYGGQKRIGICVNKEPYASQLTIVVRGILGDYNVSNESRGWTLELENGAKVFSVSKSYSILPNKQDLIDDFCVYDLLEQQPCTGFISKDTGTVNIYPTAREYFSSLAYSKGI